MVYQWQVWLRASLILLVVVAMVSCAGADGEPGRTYTMMVVDDGVELSPPLGVGREQPDMLSNTWYDYESNDLEDNFVYGNTAYRGSMRIEIDGEISNTPFEDGADAQDFYLLQYASTSGYVMYVFTERFEPAVGPDTTPIALLSLDGAGPLSLETADFSSLPFGNPRVIPFADDIPDTNGDGIGNFTDFENDESFSGTSSGPIRDYESTNYRWLLDEPRLDSVPGEFVSMVWFLEKRVLTP